VSIPLMASVYDGTQIVGHVLYRIDARAYEAVDLGHRSYGMFATQREAAAALPSRSPEE
jgi:hypothetical protein